MKLQLLAAVFAGSAISFVLVSSPTRAEGTTFVCGQSNGVPATLAKVPQGDVPVILWKSDYFTEAGYNPLRRCQMVSERFQTYYNLGAMNYLTTGRMNGQNVVCAARSEGGPCAKDLPNEGLLFTIKADSNPGETLENLLQVRHQARGPISESNPRVYINLNEFIKTKLAQTTMPSSPSVQPPVIKPAPESGNSIW